METSRDRNEEKKKKGRMPKTRDESYMSSHWGQVSPLMKSQEARHAGEDVSIEAGSHHCSVNSMAGVERKRDKKNERRRREK